ncbi:MAG: GTPase HflX, partial [Jeotgalicoccus halophilus]|nr:GTPase HflX [Jeotgalicoccus aerolatus]
MNMTHTGIILATNTVQNKDVASEVRELKELAESIGIEIIGTH